MIVVVACAGGGFSPAAPVLADVHAGDFTGEFGMLFRISDSHLRLPGHEMPGIHFHPAKADRGDHCGMPSSHSSSAMGVTAACGIFLGYDHPVFIVALVFTLIVMYDAANVRLESGKHAEIINDLVDFARTHKEFDAEKLKEIIGHEPFEVLMGALLGIVVAVVYFKVFYIM